MAERGPCRGRPMTESATVIKRRSASAAYDRHGGVLPHGFRIYFRRYGKHGGRWRGVGPSGWVECGGPNGEQSVTDEVWWMVAAYDYEARLSASSEGAG